MSPYEWFLAAFLLLVLVGGSTAAIAYFIKQVMRDE